MKLKFVRAPEDAREPYSGKKLTDEKIKDGEEWKEGFEKAWKPLEQTVLTAQTEETQLHWDLPELQCNVIYRFKKDDWQSGWSNPLTLSAYQNDKKNDYQKALGCMVEELAHNLLQVQNNFDVKKYHDDKFKDEDKGMATHVAVFALVKKVFEKVPELGKYEYFEKTNTTGEEKIYKRAAEFVKKSDCNKVLAEALTPTYCNPRSKEEKETVLIGDLGDPHYSKKEQEKYVKAENERIAKFNNDAHRPRTHE